jgi:hypothetical protein
MFASRIIIAFASVALIGLELPSVDKVISQTTVNIPRMRIEGQCESSNPEESGPFEIWINSPKIAISLKRGDLRTGFDGNQLWRQQRGQPAIKLPLGPLTEAIAIFDPARRLRWKELHLKIAVVRREKLGGRTAFVLETDPGAPSTARFYIDTENGDLIRAKVLPGLTFEMSGHRKLNGWPMPFEIVQTTPPGTVYNFRVSKANAVDTIDDGIFSVP